MSLHIQTNKACKWTSLGTWLLTLSGDELFGKSVALKKMNQDENKICLQQQLLISYITITIIISILHNAI